MRITLIIFLLQIGLNGFAQMNIAQVKSQLPALQLPFECPTQLPASNWGDEELNLSEYPYVKKDVTALFQASSYASGEYDRYLGLGYLNLGKSTALVYLWENVSINDGMYRYAICMDTYDEKGEFVDHIVLSRKTWQSLHDLDPDYTGAPENSNESINCSLHKHKDLVQLKRNSEQTITRLVGTMEGYDPDAEPLEISRTTRFDLYEVLPSGKILPMYVDESY